MVVVAKDTAMPEHGNLQVLVSQAIEIEAMQGLLQRKGFPVVNTESPRCCMVNVMNNGGLLE
jgi:hypothetical protein